MAELDDMELELTVVGFPELLASEAGWEVLVVLLKLEDDEELVDVAIIAE